MKTSIIENGLAGSLEIVNMVRLYHLFEEDYVNHIKKDYDPRRRYMISSLIEKLSNSRDKEFLCMMDDVFRKEPPQDKDNERWRSLRKTNIRFSSALESFIKTNIDFSSPTAFTSSSSSASTLQRALPFPPSQDEDPMRTLINMLNMLSFYKFDSRMKASTSTMAPTIAPFTPYEKDNKWHLKPEVLTLFNRALEATFPHFTEKCMMFCSKNDFQCDNVVSIWPKIKKERKNYPDIKGPTDVGERIKNGLVKLKSPMIEGEPCVYGVGFVKIKLSGNWMAENIHKMLRDGIDTWAPRQQLDFRSTIVNSPSWDEFNLMPMDVLRRQLIIMSRMHMLEYVNSAAATTSSGNGMSLPPGKFNNHFRSVEKEGKVLIYIKDEGNTEPTDPIICGKSRISHVERDGCSGYPLEDLAALWHGIEIEKADWIMCVAPSQQQDYIESCFNAAELAGWTTDSLWPLATYVGFKTCSASLEDLLSFLFKAQYPCEAGEAAKVLGYTNEAVLDCALMYTFLKYHRLDDCTFSDNEMFDVKGDTFVHLITTQAQICKITNHSRKDIDDLKKDSKLVLEEDKVVWCEGVERELGFRLLMFTELIQESYLCFFPHLVCRYLYNLSEKFNRFYESYASLGFEEKTKLLLCEATAVVMEKGFQLLGITQKPSLQALSVALALNYVAPLETRNPLRTLNIRTRFEVFTAYIDITRDPEFKDGKLFGWIGVTDYYGLRPDGWGKLRTPGPDCVNLLSRDCLDSVKIRNSGRLKIGNPSSRHSVPFSSCMRIAILIYARL